MKRKGYNFRFAGHLTFRPLRPKDLENGSYRNSRVVDRKTVVLAGKEYVEGMTGYSVIVRVRACLDKDGKIDDEKREAAKPIPFWDWSRTNMLYGLWRKQTRGRCFWVPLKKLDAPEQRLWRNTYEADKEAGYDTSYWHGEGGDVQVYHRFPVYWTSPIYWIEDGVVYTATARTYEEPKNA